MSVEFVKVARVVDVPEKRSKLIYLDNEQIALWRVNGKVYAINNVCPHQHFALLHQGTLDGVDLTCPMHGWTFCLEDGTGKSGNGKARVYQVKVEGEDLYVERPPKSW